MVKPEGGKKAAVDSGKKGETITIKDEGVFEQTGIPRNPDEYDYMTAKEFYAFQKEEGLRFRQKGPVELEGKQITSSRKRADEALVDRGSKEVYVSENKRQTSAGSVLEKLETGQWKWEYWSTIAKSIGFELKGFFFLVTGAYFTEDVRKRLDDIIKHYESIDANVKIIFVDE